MTRLTSSIGGHQMSEDLYASVLDALAKIQSFRPDLRSGGGGARGRTSSFLEGSRHSTSSPSSTSGGSINSLDYKIPPGVLARTLVHPHPATMGTTTPTVPGEEMPPQQQQSQQQSRRPRYGPLKTRARGSSGLPPRKLTYAELAQMDQESFLKALYDDPELAQAVAQEHAKEQQKSSAPRMKRSQTMKPQQPRTGQDSTKYRRGAVGTETEFVEGLKKGGVPVVTWTVLIVVIAGGIYYLYKILVGPEAKGKPQHTVRGMSGGGISQRKNKSKQSKSKQSYSSNSQQQPFQVVEDKVIEELADAAVEPSALENPNNNKKKKGTRKVVKGKSANIKQKSNPKPQLPPETAEPAGIPVGKAKSSTTSSNSAALTSAFWEDEQVNEGEWQTVPKRMYSSAKLTGQVKSAGGGTAKPETAGESKKSEVAGEFEKLEAGGESKKPEATAEPESPETAAEPNKPEPVTAEPNKLETAGEAKKPKAAGKPDKPETAGEPEKPLPLSTTTTTENGVNPLPKNGKKKKKKSAKNNTETATATPPNPSLSTEANVNEATLPTTEPVVVTKDGAEVHAPGAVLMATTGENSKQENEVNPSSVAVTSKKEGGDVDTTVVKENGNIIIPEEVKPTQVSEEDVENIAQTDVDDEEEPFTVVSKAKSVRNAANGITNRDATLAPTVSLPNGAQGEQSGSTDESGNAKTAPVTEEPVLKLSQANGGSTVDNKKKKKLGKSQRKKTSQPPQEAPPLLPPPESLTTTKNDALLALELQTQEEELAKHEFERIAAEADSVVTDQPIPQEDDVWEEVTVRRKRNRPAAAPVPAAETAAVPITTTSPAIAAFAEDDDDDDDDDE